MRLSLHIHLVLGQENVSKDILDAIEWQTHRTAEETIRYREHVISSLECAGKEMWSNGTCSRWLSNADADVAKVSATVNGTMLEDLCKSVGYEDIDCIDFFRKGMLHIFCVCSFFK